VKEQASQAISATQKSATEEITKAGQHASDNATKAAQKAIDEALDKPGVQRLIQHSVEEKVASAVEEQIQRDLSPKIDVFRSLVTEIGEISNRGAQLRLGFRPGLDYLVKKMESGDPAVRAYAKSTLIVIGADYDQKIRQLADTTPNSDPLMAIGGIGMTGAAKNPKRTNGAHTERRQSSSRRRSLLRHEETHRLERSNLRHTCSRKVVRQPQTKVR
jgi:hypothetical protein